LEVLALCDGKVQGWATRIRHLTNGTYHHAPIATLGDLRRTSDAQLLKAGKVGRKLVRELRRFSPATLRSYRAVSAEARAALRMIRDVVEQHAPPGSLPNEGSVGDGVRNDDGGDAPADRRPQAPEEQSSRAMGDIWVPSGSLGGTFSRRRSNVY
jgi:hypothetical protein